MTTRKKRLQHAPSHQFLKRLARNFAFGALIIVLSLFLGMVGYHYIEHLSWVDSFLNASMILSGMGEIANLHSAAGKIFAGFYALFSGVVFLVTVAIIFAPLIHHFFHKFHLALEKEK